MRGVENAVMAKMIEFYVPASFQWKSNWHSGEKRGKLVQFPVPRPIGDALQVDVSRSNYDRVKSNIYSVFRARLVRG